MGILTPRCIAANKEAVFFVASGVSKDIHDGQELVVLVRSGTRPDLISGTVKWSVAEPRVKQEVYTVFRARYDPDVPALADYGTKNHMGTELGEWLVMPMYPTSPIWNTQRSWIHGETLEAQFVQFPTPGDRLPILTKPWIEIGTIMQQGSITDFRLPKVNITEANGVVHSLQYGDGQLYIVLKYGEELPSPPYPKLTYNRTLTYFPFNAPWTLTSPPAQLLSVPWDLDCKDTIASDLSKTGVAHNSFYYICQRPSDTSLSNLYTFDSTTKVRLGPYPVNFGVARTEDMVLTYGPDNKGSPQFAIVPNYVNNTFYYTSVTPDFAGTVLGSGTFDTSGFQVDDNIKDFIPKEGRGKLSAVALGLISAGAVLVVGLIITAVFVQRRRRLARRHVAPTLVHRSAYVEEPLPCEYDYELPLYTLRATHSTMYVPEEHGLQEIDQSPSADETSTTTLVVSTTEGTPAAPVTPASPTNEAPSTTIPVATETPSTSP
ncbi:hypothetical protein BGZ94_001015, partial [Podila epigama]